MVLGRIVAAVVAGALAMCATPTQAATTKTVPKKKVPFCQTYKCIALTFDDGPAAYTDKVLATLKKYGAKATFFVIGNRVAKHPKLTQHIAKAGMEIGNHTWDHKYLTELNYTQVYQEIKKSQALIKKTTKQTPKVFRAPGGLRNGNVEAISAKFKMIQVPGTTATQDYIKDYRDVSFLTDRALEVAEPGAVVLMHETVKETVISLPTVLKELKAQGYHFVTVSKLLEGQKLIPGQVYPEIEDPVEEPFGEEPMQDESPG
ncbi:polysaccharide deacetylase family protein [Streptosporangiaceae bacterium NEAU-GS5]|nr:polysaccharide deacetylase family protein [Streptosporangiaceae bacterium NEAU-GS5]